MQNTAYLGGCSRFFSPSAYRTPRTASRSSLSLPNPHQPPDLLPPLTVLVVHPLAELPNEGEKNGEEADGKGGHEDDEGAFGLAFAVGDGGLVEDLEGGGVLGFADLGDLVLLCQQLVEGFLHLVVPQQPGVLKADAGDVGDGDDAVVGDGFSGGRFFETAKLGLKLPDGFASGPDLGILFGLGGEKNAEFDFLAGDLPPQAGDRFDDRRGLGIDLDGLVRLLEFPKAVFGRGQVGLDDGEALFKENPLASGAVEVDLDVELLELFDIGVGQFGGELRVFVVDADGDEPGLLVGRSPDFCGQSLVSVRPFLPFVALHKAEALDDRVGDPAALQHPDVQFPGPAAGGNPGKSGQVSHSRQHRPQPPFFLLGRKEPGGGGIDIGHQKGRPAGQKKSGGHGADNHLPVAGQNEKKVEEVDFVVVDFVDRHRFASGGGFDRVF